MQGTALSLGEVTPAFLWGTVGFAPAPTKMVKGIFNLQRGRQRTV